MENKQYFLEEESSPRDAILSLIRETSDAEILRQELEHYHDNDIAAVLEELSEEERSHLLHAVGHEAMSDIVAFLEDASDYLSTLDAEEAADIIEQMDADDALEALEDLDLSTRERVLDRITDEEVKEDLRLLGSYDEDEFGSKMSTNFIAVKRGESIKSAMRILIREAAENDNIYTLFVTDEQDRFYGAIDLKDLIVARSTDSLDSLICTTFPFVRDKDLISGNIERLRGYSEDLIPVLSTENGTLLGVITATDMTELVDEELGDDYAKLAALGAEETRGETLLASMKKRVPWLIALLAMGLFVSAVVSLFEGVVNELPMIVAFQSLILGMAGNVGTQSLAVTVRTLGTDESGGKKTYGFAIFKETRIALLNGIALGLISFAVVFAYLCLVGTGSMDFALSAAGCVGLAMCFAMTISGFTGAAIPVCLSRLGADPAVASGPLITTVNDLVAVISYYGLAWLLLLRIQ